MVVAYLGYFGGAVQNYVGHNWIIIPFIVYMICTLARGKGILASLLSTPILVWFGKISYCFYAFQALVILTLIRFHDPIVQVAPVFSDNTSFLILALGLLVALSAVGYYLIEEPARKWIRQTYA